MIAADVPVDLPSASEFAHPDDQGVGAFVAFRSPRHPRRATPSSPTQNPARFSNAAIHWSQNRRCSGTSSCSRVTGDDSALIGRGRAALHAPTRLRHFAHPTFAHLEGLFPISHRLALDGRAGGAVRFRLPRSVPRSPTASARSGAMLFLPLTTARQTPEHAASAGRP